MENKKKLEIAESAYINAVGCIKRIFNIKSGSTAYSKEYSNALWNFESALQGVLLYAVLDIGKLTESAKTFIADNCISGNIFKDLNSAGKRKLFAKWETLNWDNIDSNNMPKEKVQEAVKEAIGVCAQNFVFPVGNLDADITPKSYADEISSYVKTMIQAVCAPDFSDQELKEMTFEERTELVSRTLDAITAGIKVFNDAFLVYWKNSNELD